ncbi:hypothetical protein A3B50_01325 [Candidatus Roizmanbacteria bacterium RIFCSPLOWO2_01_FULL_40_42]|uniref:SHS2 domain-containing protein n=1 Tax=Candidatus Roizmanbacteria bacterium RIFCSPLOWO2_01_FULL_40_42 TaxID=1802066 RepID=A0A1F7J5L1_9BACT|nr:MAG: hypothetical protein A2W49_03240 [Candidatus Roizmanbacteria bacterium RIFCSPHIGHO2_12_41_18]OGK50900.1 MAG: hypothetical protein A3B50_01325 [Candidatus Roizmanbacteria bacterium RIFCSPLOWO2_01_FULL_40_42]
MANDFFCIDLGESFIRISDIKKAGNLFEAKSLGMIDVDPVFFRAEAEGVTEKQAAVLSKAIAQLKITKKNVNIVIPDSYSYNQFIETPKLNEKELLSAIKYQADQFIPMPLEEINLDIEILKDDEKNKKILTLIAAAPKKIVSKVESLAEYAGLAPQTIETEISAIGRLIGDVFKPQAKTETPQGFLFINLNFSSTSVYFFDKSLGILVFSYNFSIGYNLFLKEIQINLNVDQKKAIELLKTLGMSKNASYNLQAILTPVVKDFLGEIQKAITLLKQKYNTQVTNIYTFNETSRFHALEEIIGKYFAIPTSNFNLYSMFAKNSTVDALKNDLGFFVPSIGANLR